MDRIIKKGGQIDVLGLLLLTLVSFSLFVTASVNLSLNETQEPINHPPIIVGDFLIGEQNNIENNSNGNTGLIPPGIFIIYDEQNVDNTTSEEIPKGSNGSVTIIYEEVSNITFSLENTTNNISPSENVTNNQSSVIIQNINDITKDKITNLDNYISSLGFAKINISYEFDVDYVKNYFSMMNNFSTTKDFENIQEISTFMKVRNKEDNIRAYTIANKNYVIHLLGCSASDFTCAFRINGIPTKKLKEGDTFSLNDGYSLKVNSIIIDYCDNQRYCDLSYEAYDLVEVSIVFRG